MYEEVFQKTNSQFNELLNPARKFNSLLLDNLEKLSHFQLDAVRSYTDLGLSQLRAALEIEDVNGLQSYVSNQSKVAETLGQKLAEDANTLASLGKNFGAEFQKLAQENVVVLSQATQKVQPKETVKASARKSA